MRATIVTNQVVMKKITIIEMNKTTKTKLESIRNSKKHQNLVSQESLIEWMSILSRENYF